jgi:hypothetical protein
MAAAKFVRIPNAVRTEYSQPARFSLSQNYPNPFNPTTEIQYSLENASHVSLKVYDLLGREIALLKDATESAGIHRVAFEGRSLSGGIYFYTLRAGQFTETKKMSLLR